MQKAISLSAGVAKLVYNPKPSEPAKWVMLENQSGSTVLYWRQKNGADDTLQDADAHSLLTGERVVFDGQEQAKLPITAKCASGVSIILSYA